MKYRHKKMFSFLVQHFKFHFARGLTLGAIKQSKKSQYLPNGFRIFNKLCIAIAFQVVIDGLYFYVRNGIVFLDCFRCSKAVALSLYGSHIAEFHNRESIECRADNCRKTVIAASIQVETNLLF